MNILPRKKLVEKTLAKVRMKYNIHGRAFTKEDFYGICRGEEILLFNSLEFQPNVKKIQDVAGFCIFSPKHNCHGIYLKCFFQRRFNLLVALHELGHYFLRHCVTGATAKFKSREQKDKKYEPEADYFAELALSAQPLKEVQNG